MQHNQNLQKLIELFGRLPGVGPRQAARFVYTLIDEEKDTLKNLSGHIAELVKIQRCEHCFLVCENDTATCHICTSVNRDGSVIMVVEKDTDLANIESASAFNGIYHVTGGTLSPLKPDPKITSRLKTFYNRVKNSPDVKEIILATSATTDGEHTSRYIEKIIEPLQTSRKIKISRLGRGLSTGTELEYSDHTTIKNALDNRK